MLRTILGLTLTLLLGMSLSACDNEQPPAAPGSGGSTNPGTGGIAPGPGPGTGGTGAGGIGGTAGSGAAGGATGGGGMAGNGGVGGAVAREACNNTDDLMALAALGDPSEARRVSATCGTTIPACSGLLDRDSCILNATVCVEGRIQGLSSECASCYGELAWCAVGCNVTCAQNPCLACLTLTTCNGGTYSQCQTQLGACTGPLPAECSPS